MSKINVKSQEKGDLTKGALSVSLFLIFNEMSNSFFETPCTISQAKLSLLSMGHRPTKWNS